MFVNTTVLVDLSVGVVAGLIAYYIVKIVLSKRTDDSSDT